MASINKVIIVGRLGKEPELKDVGQSQVCKFSVATSEKWTDKNGQKQERTEWHNIVVWGKLADICGTYLKKGSEVYIEGKLQTESYEKDGQKKYITNIVAATVQFIGGGSGGGASEGGNYASDEDIPF